MSIWAIIPVKPFTNGKSRLSGVLDEGARSTLIQHMLERVVRAAAGSVSIDRVFLVGVADSQFPGVECLDDPGGGLNAAVHSALGEANRNRAERVIFIHADLPFISVEDVDRLATAGPTSVQIASDQLGHGTNAISLPLPMAMHFKFAFGSDSFIQHRAEAARLGLEVHEIHSRGLAQDVDEPDDLLHVLKSSSGGGLGLQPWQLTSSPNFALG